MVDDQQVCQGPRCMRCVWGARDSTLGWACMARLAALGSRRTSTSKSSRSPAQVNVTSTTIAYEAPGEVGGSGGGMSGEGEMGGAFGGDEGLVDTAGAAALLVVQVVPKAVPHVHTPALQSSVPSHGRPGHECGLRAEAGGQKRTWRSAASSSSAAADVQVRARAYEQRRVELRGHVRVPVMPVAAGGCTAVPESSDVHEIQWTVELTTTPIWKVPALQRVSKQPWAALEVYPEMAREFSKHMDDLASP